MQIKAGKNTISNRTATVRDELHLPIDRHVPQSRAAAVPPEGDHAVHRQRGDGHRPRHHPDAASRRPLGTHSPSARFRAATSSFSLATSRSRRSRRSSPLRAGAGFIAATAGVAGASSSSSLSRWAKRLLLLPGSPVQPHHQVAGGEPVHSSLELALVPERMQPLGPLAQLPRSLGPAEHQHRQHRHLAARQPQSVVEQVPVLGRPLGPHAAAITQPPQPVERVPDRRLVVVHDRVPVRRLVAGRPQRVQRQRVRVRRRPLLLDQAPQHPHLDGVEIHARERNGGTPRPPGQR